MSLQENIFKEVIDSDDETGYYVANITRRPQDIYQDEVFEHDAEDEDETDEENEISTFSGGNRSRSRARSDRRGGGRNRNTQSQQINLPSSPSFNKFAHQYPLYNEPHLNLPYEYSILDSITPYDIFKLFFSNEILRTIVNNTNKYGKQKKEDSWMDIDFYEFLTWLGIIIYSGIYKTPSFKDFWNKDERMPIHFITSYMQLQTFKKIKNFLHISDIYSDHPFWYSKLEPLASHINDVSQSIYIPSSNVAVDEMIIRFCGRSAHTFRMKNKPTPEGYKVLALCDAGYTYSFMFTSRIEKDHEIEQIEHLNKMGNQVYHLIKKLPSNQSFNIFMDNYFSSIKLFKFLREKGIGACGTVRTNSSGFPPILKIKNKNLEWDTLSGVVVDDVLAVLWMDNGPVTMLSTIHEITGKLISYVAILE